MTTVLLISPEPWEGHFVSKHHYAIELARRGHRVIYFGPPVDGPLVLEPVEKTEWGRLEILRGPRAAPGLRWMPSQVRRTIEALWLERVERLAGARIEVVWLFENSRFFDMRFAGDRLKIYQQVDLNQDFYPYLAATTADLAIAISDPIQKKIERSAKKLLRLTHGCNVLEMEDCRDPGVAEAFGRHRVNAVMTGNLSIGYLDQELVSDLVFSQREVGFHFVGGYTPGTGLHRRISGASNVFFWGLRPAKDLPAFLCRADVLLVAYRADEYSEQLANPHKIMEYLAAGKCVIATRTMEYERRPDLVVVCMNKEEYKLRFASIVGNPDAYNTPELINHRRSFAKNNTYSRQIDRIIESLGAKGMILS